MTPNVCQAKKLDEHEIGPLCRYCRSDGNCIWQHHVDFVQKRGQSDTYQLAQIDACSFFVDNGEGNVSSQPIYKLAVFQAKVHNLCQGCRSSLDETCQPRADLDKVTELSTGYGDESPGQPGWVHAAVVTCVPRHNGERLYQISDPRKRAETP